MANDNTPPRIRLIVTVTFITVVTLVALKFVFDSYFAYMSDQATHEKLAEPVARRNLAEIEKKHLTGSPLPIEAAMAKLAQGARTDGDLSDVEPKPSEDNGPLIGWSKLPKPLPTPHPRPVPTLGDATTPDGGPTMAAADGDAGAPTAHDAHDGGAAHAAHTDPAPPMHTAAPIAPVAPAPAPKPAPVAPAPKPAPVAPAPKPTTAPPPAPAP
jgi:hypothetical protein